MFKFRSDVGIVILHVDTMRSSGVNHVNQNSVDTNNEKEIRGESNQSGKCSRNFVTLFK